MEAAPAKAGSTALAARSEVAASLPPPSEVGGQNHEAEKQAEPATDSVHSAREGDAIRPDVQQQQQDLPPQPVLLAPGAIPDRPTVERSPRARVGRCAGVHPRRICWSATKTTR